jgi:hypothetical protein
MKKYLMLIVLITGSAYGAQKKMDVRPGTRKVDEKFLDTMNPRHPSEKKLSHDVQTSQNRIQQINSKRDRQYQEEEPATSPYGSPE